MRDRASAQRKIWRVRSSITAMAGRLSPRLRRPAQLGALLLAMAVIVSGTTAILARARAQAAHSKAAQSTPADLGVSITNGAATFAGYTRQTPPAFTFPVDAGQGLAVDPLFAPYYAAHGGAALLGRPLTTAYPTTSGWVQIYSGGALFAAAPRRPNAQAGGTLSTGAVQRLDVVAALLAAGSLVRIGGDDGSLTYADLRAATAPSSMQTSPAAAQSQAPGFFIGEGHRGATVLGHTIAQPFWSYITNPNIAPDGWLDDLGLPLTEALPATATRDGAPHHLLVQVFWNAALVLDQDAPTANGARAINVLHAGLAYLRTFAPPTAALDPAATLWSTANIAVDTQPGGGSATVHLGANFSLTAAGDDTSTQWVNGALWYHLRWDMPHQHGDGWLPASAVTFRAPSAPAAASFDVLSPDLANYLAGYGANAAAVVYDETRNVYYTYNPTGAFTMASSAKVPIMLTYLTWTESQGREPNDYELSLLTTMIENSNNASAQTLYETLGYDGRIAAFLNSIGIHDWTPNGNGWGWSTLSPLSMVRLLTLLHDGKVLTAQDRQLALNLMENIEPDEQVGVGDTAPSGAVVAMKDGWVTGPDNLWAVNTSGIVTRGGETYIVAVYSQHLNDLGTGWAIARQVCSAVAAALT